MGEKRGVYSVLVGKSDGKRPRCRWRITLRWIFRKWDVGSWNELIWPRIETGGGLL